MLAAMGSSEPGVERPELTALPRFHSSDSVKTSDGERIPTPPSSSNSSQRTPRPNWNRSRSDQTLEDWQRSPTQDANKSRPKGLPAKKKPAGVLGFLTLKEPSTLALEEFAAAEKQKAKAKGNRSSTRPSTQRLPNHVPKVNSKWDGLPDMAKRSTDSKRTDRTHRNSTFSTSTRESNWTAITSMSSGSKESKKSCALSSSTRSSKTAKCQSPRPTKTSTSSRVSIPSPPNSAGQPPPLAFDPEDQPTMVEETDENRPQTFLHPPSPPLDASFAEFASAPSPQELEAAELFYLHEMDARSSTNTPPDPLSPLTPPADTMESPPALVGIHYPELAMPEQISAADRAATFLYSDTENEDNCSKSERPRAFNASINFSRPRNKKIPSPITTQRSTPDSGRQSIADDVMLSPTLTDSSGRVDPFLTDTFASHSRETGHIPRRVQSTIRPIVEEPRKSTSTNSPPLSPLASGESEPNRPFSALSSELTDSTRPSTAASSSTSGSVETAFHEQRKLSTIRLESEESLPASAAASVMGKEWQMSPKERLGLGSKVRMNEVLPWESFEVLADAREPVKLGTTLRPPTDARLKRLSWRLGAKR